MDKISTDAVIWEKCFGKEICGHIPFDGKKCLSAKGCVRIIQAGEGFQVELELFGHRVRHVLHKTCYPAYAIGIARLEVCVDPKLVDGKLKGVVLSANLCVGGKIDKVKLEKCWKVIRSTIEFFHVSSFVINPADAMQIEDESLQVDMALAGQEYVYVETDELEASVYVTHPIDHSKMG